MRVYMDMRVHVCAYVFVFMCECVCVLTCSQPPARRNFEKAKRVQPRGKYLVSDALNFWNGHEFGPAPLTGL